MSNTAQQIRILFNKPNIPATATVPVRAAIPELPATAYSKVDSNYYFDDVLLKKMLRFFVTTPARRNLMLIGDSAVGKTSLVEQMATRLGWPVFTIAGSGKLRLQHLVGTYELVDGETVWRDGPLTTAARVGGVFLLNEITRMDASEQMSLANVLDDGRLTIPDTGEVVEAHPDFRFCATGNSGGYGDESGAYNGERTSSVAFLDRFLRFKLDYMPAAEESALLKRVVKSRFPQCQMQDGLFDCMVKLATDVRKAFVSRGGDLRTIVSTRSLVAWALTAASYGDISRTPVEEALCDTILNGSPDQDVSVIKEIWSNWITTLE